MSINVLLTMIHRMSTYPPLHFHTSIQKWDFRFCCILFFHWSISLLKLISHHIEKSENLYSMPNWLVPNRLITSIEILKQTSFPFNQKIIEILSKRKTFYWRLYYCLWWYLQLYDYPELNYNNILDTSATENSFSIIKDT